MRRSELGWFELTEIKTDVSARNFARLIETKPKKTFFLNGAWGSGKSTYLKKTFKYSHKKAVYIHLWQPTDNKTIVANIFNKIHPVLYAITILIMVGSAIAFLAFTGSAYKILIEGVNSFWYWVWATISLSVSVYMFLGIQSDSVYLWILRRKCVSYLHWRKALIIDDFDRVSFANQEDAYKVLNILNGKVPIIFVGDYSKLGDKTDQYLSKIIDKRVELPALLQPTNIWNVYINQLTTIFDKTDLRFLQSLFISEQRNLRDRDRFNEYVKHEFIERNKLNHVVISEQLLIIYLYVFHSDIYNILTYRKPSNIDLKEHASVKDMVLRLWGAPGEKSYPERFINNQAAYFLYETPNNKTIEDLEAVFFSGDELSQYLNMEITTDFSAYLTAYYDQIGEFQKEVLLYSALVNIGKYNKTSILHFVIEEHINSSPEYKKLVNDVNFGEGHARDVMNFELDFWEDLLMDAGYDQSMSLYFFYSYTSISIGDLGEIYSFGDLNTDDKIPVARLLVYLSSIDLWTDFDSWTSQIWSYAYMLPTEQFLEFGRTLKFLTKDPIFETNLIFHKNIAINGYSTVDTTTVYNNLSFKLKKLEQEGYTIELDEENPLKD